MMMMNMTKTLTEQNVFLADFLVDSQTRSGATLGTFSRILFSQTNNCAPRTIFFLSFHTFFIVHRSVLTVKT